MKFVDNLTEKEYTNFYNKFEYSHFLQSYGFGQAIEETRGKKAVYVGLKDKKGNVKAAALLLKKTLPFGFSYFYSIRGFLIDYKNKELLKDFTDGLKDFMKKNKGIYVKNNPEIMYHEIDYDGNKVPDGKNNYEIFNNLKSLGYVHKGFVKLYENNEPRYTYRRYLKDYDSFDEIKKDMAKSFIQKVNKSFTYNLKVNTNSNVDNFFELNKNNAARDGFLQYSDAFYKSLYNNCKKNNNVNVFDISVNGKELYENCLKSYNELKEKLDNNLLKRNEIPDANNQIERLKKELVVFEEYKDKGDMVICSMINGVSNKKLWTMYQGNDHLGEFLFAVNRIYYEIVKYAYENDFEYVDLYGTVGDAETKYKNLGGLHKYKRSFGGTYIEFIGEFDLVGNKFMYKVLPILLKVYRLFNKLRKGQAR